MLSDGVPVFAASLRTFVWIFPLRRPHHAGRPRPGQEVQHVGGNHERHLRHQGEGVFCEPAAPSMTAVKKQGLFLSLFCGLYRVYHTAAICCCCDRGNLFTLCILLNFSTLGTSSTKYPDLRIYLVRWRALLIELFSYLHRFSKPL